jgi:hypothetical protein
LKKEMMGPLGRLTSLTRMIGGADGNDARANLTRRTAKLPHGPGTPASALLAAVRRRRSFHGVTLSQSAANIYKNFWPRAAAKNKGGTLRIGLIPNA